MAFSNEGRFYEAEFPQIDEVVVVQVKRIVDMGAYVSLLEYGGREGMMLLSELSKRRIRSVAKLLKVGRTETCMVLRADHDKGYVDLSKRRVDADDAKAKDEWFAKAKAVHGIMRHVASLHNVDTDELCKKVSWPLYAKYPDAHEAFRKHVNEEINVWSELDFSQPGEDITDKAEALKADIEIYLRRRLIAQALRLRAKVDVSCSGFEGIDAIKEALMKGFDASIEECEVKIKLIAHPMFMLTCQCTEKAIGENVLKKAVELIQKEIEAKGGEYALRMAPELVGQEDKGHDDDIPSDVSSGEEGSDGPQDETMGDIDEKAMKELMEKTKHLDAEDDK